MTECDTAFHLSEGNTEALSIKGFVLAQMGRRTEADQILKTLLDTSRTRFVPPYNVALLYAGLGATDAACEWLEKARLIRDVHLVFLTVEPKWNGLRGRPAFRALLERCALAAPEVETRNRPLPSRQRGSR